MRPSNTIRTSTVAEPTRSSYPPPRTSFGDPTNINPNEPHKRHHDYDPAFHGPIRRRSCTDIICLIILVIYLAWWVYVAQWAWSHADTDRITKPTDFRGQICGKGVYAHRPYLQLFDLTQCTQPLAAIAGCPTPSVCVSDCSDRFWLSLAVLDLTDVEEAWRARLVCLDEVNRAAIPRLDVFNAVARRQCAFYTLPTAPVLNGICLPTVQTFNLTAFVDMLQSTTTKLNDQSNQLNALAPAGTIPDNMIEVNFTLLRTAAATIVKSIGFLDNATRSIEDTWRIIVVIACITIVVTFVWISVMRYFSSLLVWVSLIVVIALFSACAGYAWKRFFEQKQIDAETHAANSAAIVNLDVKSVAPDLSTVDTAKQLVLINGLPVLNITNLQLQNVTAINAETELSQLMQSATFWLAIACISSIILITTLIILCFLRNRIKIAIALVDEACKATSKMMFVLIFPIVPFIGMAIVAAFFLFVLVLLQATKTPHYLVLYKDNRTDFILPNGTACNFQNFTQQYQDAPAVQNQQVQCQFVGYNMAPEMLAYEFTNIFGYFWMTMFCVGFGQLVIAGSYAGYYWTWDKKNGLPSFPVMASVYRAVMFHMGSIAVGAFLIAVVKMIRYVIRKVQKLLSYKKDYKLVLCMLKMVQCCMYCLEKFLKFITRNAYIMIALYGRNFFWSAKESFWLLFRNILRAAVLNRIVAFLLLLSKLGILGGIVALSWAVYSKKLGLLTQSVPNLSLWWVPVVVNGVIALIIVQIFFDVFGMGVDTLFLCFLEDLERNDGSRERPYYMSKRLMKILSKKNVEVSSVDVTGDRITSAADV